MRMNLPGCGNRPGQEREGNWCGVGDEKTGRGAPAPRKRGVGHAPGSGPEGGGPARANRVPASGRMRFYVEIFLRWLAGFERLADDVRTEVSKPAWLRFGAVFPK